MQILLRFILVCLINVLFVVLSFAQATLSGKVIDKNGEPIPVVNILVMGTSSGGTTDFDGKYSFQVTELRGTLSFSSVGYKTIEVSIEGRNTVDVTMEESFTQLDEVIVVGYGVQKKSDISGAISSINNKDFKDQPVSNLGSSIQGRVSGLQVVTPSGTPGAGLLVSVRGSQNPLYVVDGIPLLSESNSSLATSFDTEGNVTGNGQSVSSISDINPNDIESIEILKDASAAAIYGARAANGVILITTKRGQSGKTDVNVNYYTGLQQIARNIKFMNSQQFVELVEEGRKNDLALYNNDNTIFGEDFDPSILTDPLENFDLGTGVNTDWIDEVTRIAPISNYEISARGGNDKTRFFTGVGYYDQQGIVIESFYKRLNYRLNLDHKLTDKFSIGVTTNGTYSNNRRSFNDNTYTGIITNALGASPLMPVYESDGSYSDFTQYQASWLSDNPVKSAKEIRAFTNTYRFLGTVFGEYAITPALRFKSSFSTDLTFLNDRQYLSALTTDAIAVGGRAYEGGFRGTTWLNENILSYNRSKGNHNFSALGGVTEQVSRSRSSSVAGQGFPSGGLELISSASTITGATSTGTSFALLSFLGRVNYGYKNRYLFTGTMRADGSSRFSKNNRFGYFPSGSVAWRISEEPFFKNAFLTDLKARVSYGLTGDQEIGDFQNRSFYAPSRYYGQSGIKLRILSDPDLTWQTNRMLNIGIDYEIKDGKFGGSIEFFKSNKTDLLSQDLIAGTTGFATVTRNSGEVQNTGVEFNINSTAINKAKFKWNLNFNFTYVKNEIIKLSTDNVQLSAYNDLTNTHILKEGQALGTLWGIKYLGVDTQTGDAMYEDLNQDGVIDLDDSQILGRALPNFFGGLTNVFTFGNFDFTIFTRFSTGNKVYNLIRSTYENMGYANGGGGSIYANNSANVLDRWKKPGDNAEYPRASYLLENYIQNSSQYVEDGSFIRIQNAKLGYEIKRPYFCRSLRVYVEGQNLWVFTKYKGFDPEVSSTGNAERTAGVDYGAYPQARTILFGINIGF